MENVAYRATGEGFEGCLGYLRSADCRVGGNEAVLLRVPRAAPMLRYTRRSTPCYLTSCPIQLPLAQAVQG